MLNHLDRIFFLQYYNNTVQILVQTLWNCRIHVLCISILKFSLHLVFWPNTVKFWIRNILEILFERKMDHTINKLYFMDVLSILPVTVYIFIYKSMHTSILKEKTTHTHIIYTSKANNHSQIEQKRTHAELLYPVLLFCEQTSHWF